MKILPNTIVYLHEIHDPKWLDNVFASLRRNYHIIRIEELEEYYYNNRNLKNSCHITFDDGDSSFYNKAYPIIKKYKIPVSIFVSPLMAKERKNFWFQEISGYNEEKLIEITKKTVDIQIEPLLTGGIKKYLKTLQLNEIWEIIRLYQRETKTSPKPPMNMTEEQLIEVQSSGFVNIGAHTLNHPILPNETDAVATQEITGSIDLLNEVLDSETRYFVYPNGSYGEREINILKEKGIKLAFTTQRNKISAVQNPLSIPRSGSPFISVFKNNNTYIFSKCLVQLLVGEQRYYQYANTWGSVASHILK